MYKVPIELISSPPKIDIDGEIYKAIIRYGVSVDKDELIKALQYNRAQYDKGYADGKAEVALEIFEEIGKILRKYDEIAERDKSEYGEFIVGDVGFAVAELKKKYTEGET